MAVKTLPSENVKISRKGPRRTQQTTADAVSYQPEGCYVIPMVVKADKALQEELDAWEAASDEALENCDNDFPPLES